MQQDHTHNVELVDGGSVHLQVQYAACHRADVIYVHGATFPSDLSLFFRFGGRSWADALTGAGFNAWGFDFVGYGRSSRYVPLGDAPVGRSDDALPQLLAVIERVRSHNSATPVVLLGHSWGSVVAARATVAQSAWVSHLVMFGPIVQRQLALPPQDLTPLRSVTVWEQYRRFIDDVPRGHPPVLLDRHFDSWSQGYLRSDPTSASREPPSVMTPSGPTADIRALWQGTAIYDPARITQPLLVVRGEWDSLCTDADAARLLDAARSRVKRDVKIAKGTHLMHLEESRGELHQAVNEFLSHDLA